MVISYFIRYEDKEDVGLIIADASLPRIGEELRISDEETKETTSYLVTRIVHEISRNKSGTHNPSKGVNVYVKSLEQEVADSE